MEIVVATQSLSGFGGSETYAITIAEHLQRLGHDVWLHTLEPGPASEHAMSLGLRVAAGRSGLPSSPDVLVVQDGVVACELAVTYPHTPQAFVAHSDIFDLQLPPGLPDLTAVVITLYDRVDRRIRALALDHRVVRLGQPVDVERFKPTTPLRERPRVALTLGNYVHGQRLDMLRRACERASIELRHVGIHGEGQTDRPDEVLNEADIVFGKARVIYEAMACGRAAYVFDHNGGEGWVTAHNQLSLSADNFGGQSAPIAIDEDRLVSDLARYDPSMGIANRDFVVSRHSATKHVAELVDVLRELDPRSAPVDAPLRELARLVRLHFAADAQAFALRAHLERQAARIHQLESDVQAAQAQADAQAVLTDDAQRVASAEASAAEDARQMLNGLVATRRWRALQLVLRPADRARSLFDDRRSLPGR
jgi:glycosyltransferase involved in cell wall biosynthesis